MVKVNYGNESFEYRVVRKSKKHIAIMVTPEGEVVVTSPYHVDDRYVNGVVLKKSPWILSKLKLVEEVRRDIKEREYAVGKIISYLGKDFKLEIIEGNIRTAAIRFDGEHFEALVNPKLQGTERQNKIREKLKEWYRDEALKVFLERTDIYSKVLNLYPKMIRVKEQKTIWGSCSSKFNINYNWKLVMAPVDVIDYIVVHELCHLRHRDHSKNFWNLVEHVMPDYITKKEWLKVNGRRLNV